MQSCCQAAKTRSFLGIFLSHVHRKMMQNGSTLLDSNRNQTRRHRFPGSVKFTFTVFPDSVNVLAFLVGRLVGRDCRTSNKFLRYKFHQVP